MPRRRKKRGNAIRIKKKLQNSHSDSEEEKFEKICKSQNSDDIFVRKIKKQDYDSEEEFNNQLENIINQSKNEFEDKEKADIEELIIKLNYQELNNNTEEFSIIDRIDELRKLYKSVDDVEVKKSIHDTLMTLSGEYEVSLKEDYEYDTEEESENESDEFGDVEEIK